MAYTVKQLARLSNVSVRTLHWYDEKGLLKPAFLGENGYRYYEEDQLFTLQQILFFRELNFTLDDIGKLINSNDFNRLQTLQAHRQILMLQFEQKKQLLNNLDKTIKYLKGEKTVKIEDIFAGFTQQKQENYENYLVEKVGVSTKVENLRIKTQQWSKQDWLQYKKACDKVHDDLILLLEQGADVSDESVQLVIDKHYQLIKSIWIPNKDSYIALADMYGSHADFVAFYQSLHPVLLAYMRQAMKRYAQSNLS